MAGHWSDLLGRKRLYLLRALLAGAFGFVYFTLLNTAVPGWISKHISGTSDAGSAAYIGSKGRVSTFQAQK
jgi:hypothetical protein